MSGKNNLPGNLPLILAVTGLSAVQLSFVLGGVWVLDALAMLLVPAFILFIWGLCAEWKKEDKDYRYSLVALVLCLAITLIYKLRFAVATIDDNYHVYKVLGYAIRNNFSTQLTNPFDVDRGHMNPFQDQLLFIGFVESVWGIFWRLVHKPYMIVFLQALPLLVLWKVLLNFFRGRRVASAGSLSLAVVLSMQVLWVQQASGYIDSTVGIFAALTLFGLYHVFTKPQVSWQAVVGLASVSSACLISKPLTIPLGVAGAVVALWFAWRLNNISMAMTFVVVGLGISYACIHYTSVGALTGNPLFPLAGGDGKIYIARSPGSGFHGDLATFYKANPFNMLLINHGMDWRPLYVVAGWLTDFKPRVWITPDPWVGGRGLVWTYVVLAAMGWAMIDAARRRFVFKPRLGVILIGGLLFYYFFIFDGSILARYVLGMEIFVMSYALSWLWNRLPSVWRAQFTLVCIVFAAVAFYCAYDGDMLQEKPSFSFFDSQSQRINEFVQQQVLRVQ